MVVQFGVVEFVVFCYRYWEVDVWFEVWKWCEKQVFDGLLDVFVMVYVFGMKMCLVFGYVWIEVVRV